MIKKMQKIQIIGPKAYLDECIKVLHAAAMVHIEEVRADPGAEEAFLKRLPIEREKVKEKEELDKADDRLKNLLLLLKPRPSYRAVRVPGGEIFRILEEIAPVEEEAKELNARKDGLNEELATVNKYEKLLIGFAPIVSRLGGLKNFEIVGLTIEKTREDIPALLDAELKKITGGTYQLFSKELDENTTGVVLTYPKRYDSEVRSLLTGKSISEIRLPDEYADKTLIEALKEMDRKKRGLPGLINEAEREIERISAEWYGKAVGLKEAVEDAIDELGVLTYAAQTRLTFVIEGWVPVDMYGQLNEKFEKFFGSKVLVRELEIEEKETELIPVCIKNPKILKPFEVFLSALPPPRYGSVDPTPYVALFFPAFFGLIVGDIAYGAIILSLSLYLRRRFRDRAAISDILTVMSISSVSAIVFGVFFGEFFGDLGERLGILHPLLVNRIEALKTLLVFTIGIGVGHVVLGYVIGFANQLHRGRLKEAGIKFFYLVLIVSFLFILGVMFGYFTKGVLTPSVIVLIVSLVLLIALEGIIGPLEFIKTLGNILSYVRIMAVGTASVVMATVANRMGSLSDNLFLGILIAALIHTLNIFLSILSPSIQSMRLQYVEFFSKFYEGGGRKYVPFKKR